LSTAYSFYLLFITRSQLLPTGGYCFAACHAVDLSVGPSVCLSPAQNGPIYFE